MDSPALVADALDRVRDTFQRILKDLAPPQLLSEPKPPTAWLVWHVARVQDKEISFLAGHEQVWIAQGWHARFGMPPEPRDYGPGHTQIPAQVEAFTVSDKKLLLDYYDAVVQRTKEYLSALSSKDLDRVLNEPQYQPLPTVGVRLVSVMADNLRHAGQIEYLSGFIRHQSWFPSTPR